VAFLPLKFLEWRCSFATDSGFSQSVHKNINNIKYLKKYFFGMQFACNVERGYDLRKPVEDQLSYDDKPVAVDS
jgi:hypothetical protein